MRIAHFLVCASLASALAGCASPTAELNAGLWHYKAGLFTQAIPRLVDAVPAMEAAHPADPQVLRAYLALGHMASAEKAAPGIAEGYFTKAMALANKYHAGNANLSRNAASETGNYYLANNQQARALPFLLTAAEISGREQVIPRRLHAIDLDNLSVAQAALRNYALAAEYAQKALDQLAAEPEGKESAATRGVIFFNQAYAYAEQGLAVQADQRYRQSLDLIDAHGEAWRRSVVVSAYAKFLRSQQREPDAQALERRFSH